MKLTICGPGRLGRAIAAAALDAGWPAPAVVGRPGGRPRFLTAGSPGVVVDASGGSSVAANVAEAVAAGHRAFVLAATGWDADLPTVRSLLLEHGAVAVVAPNLSLGAALFARLVEAAAASYAAAGFEPSVVEWHRRGKADRPSGTARALARRIVAVDPRWSLPEMDAAAPGRPALEVAGIRAGSDAPGTHLVAFDGPGESVELRLAVRDRSTYAAGALAAARWLAGTPRPAGLHPFDAVVDDLLAAPAAALA